MLINNLIKKYDKPIVFDADALNILSENNELLSKIPENSILTPHPKEFDRLFGESKSFYDRFLKQQQKSKELKIIIVLKGAHTSVSLPNGKVYFNSSGNSGMATAGSGYVLTGIILALISQKYTPRESSVFGVYLHGLAGDIYAKKQSKESLIASDIIQYLGNAYKMLQKH
jgi:NAD(P)H-hydrate epimerase